MKPLDPRQRRIALSVAVLVTVCLAVWAVRRYRPAPLPVQVSHPLVSAESLYESGDKPTTIFVKSLDPSNGALSSVPVVIRQSKNRLNQMKQAALAFLKGPNVKNWRGLAPPGTVLNQMYLTSTGSVVLDLTLPESGEFGFYEEALLASGLTATMTQNFSEVKRVRLLNDGREEGVLVRHYALGTVESLTSPAAAVAAP